MGNIFGKIQEIKNNGGFYWEYFSEGKGDSVEEWSQQKMEEFQLDAVKSLFNHCMKNTEFYKKKFKDFSNIEINTLEDFSKLPMTTKEEVRDYNEEFLSCSKEDLGQVHISTGTSGGKPIFEYYSYEDLFVADLLPNYVKLMPVTPEDRVMIALPLEMSSSGLSFSRVFQIQKGACVLPVGKGGAYSTMEKTLEFLYNLSPTCIVTTPSYAVYIAEQALENGFDISRQANVKYMWLTGEGCSDALRKRIEKLWGASARFYYGSMEAGQIGIECSNQKFYHITSLHCMVEIVDENTGLPVEEGEIGEIVVTPLLHRGTPLVRYRTMDRGQIVNESCCSEIKLPCLKVYGRKEDQLFGKFSPFFVEQMLLSFPQVGNWYQLTEQDDTLLVEFEPSLDILNKVNNVEEIEKKLEEVLKIKCIVKVVEPKSLERPTKKLVRVKRMRV